MWQQLPRIRFGESTVEMEMKWEKTSGEVIAYQEKKNKCGLAYIK